MGSTVRINQKVFAWTAMATGAIWAVGFVCFAGFMPPPSPSDSAEQVAEVFRSRTTGIRIGMFLTMFGAAFLGCFLALISVHLKRIEGRTGALCYAQLILGTCLVIEFIYPTAFLQAAAYRSDRSAEAVQSLNDLSWLCFVGIVSTAVVQWVIIGVGFLQDKSEDPVIPRWVGYFNIWIGLLFIPSGLVPFFKDGPFAWNGLIGWWIAVLAYGLWTVVMTVVLVKAADDERSHLPGPPSPADVVQLSAELAHLRAEVNAMSGSTVGR